MIGGVSGVRTTSVRNAMKFLLLFAALTLAVYLLFFTELGRLFTHSNVPQLSAELSSFGVYSVLFGVLAVLLQTFFPVVPFVVVAGANVLVFGLWRGFAINYLSAVSGALLAFLFARYLASDWAEKKLSRYPTVQKFNRKLESRGFLYILLGRFIPVIPSTAINFGAGVSKISLRHFTYGTLIGKLPAVLFESMLGHDLLHFKQYKERLFILAVLFLLLLGIGALINKKLKEDKH